ncbi:MAG: YdcF family protein [Actinomycetota bacterium]|nr:YdcF family protein [Actinomycetota bacterium]
MAAGVARNLVVPNGRAPEWPAGNRACSDALPYDVYCPRPDPDTTRGEARVIAALAREQGWRRVIIVTSSYQVSRARLLLERCLDGEVLAVRAQPELSALAWARRVGHEWLAWTYAMTIARRC